MGKVVVPYTLARGAKDLKALRLVVLLCFAAWTIVAGAQQTRIARIGVLSPGSPPLGPLEAFRSGLRDFGYVEGRNIEIQWRFAEGRNERLPHLVDELVSAKMDVLFVINTQAAQLAKKSAGTIPVVFARVSDPRKTGLVASLSRPGGNLTGVSNVADELGGKRLEMLKNALPHLSHAAVLWNSGNPGVALILKDIQAAGPDLGVQIYAAGMRGPAEMPDAFESIRKTGVEALFVLDDLLITSFKRPILEFAAENRLPVMSLYEEFVEDGGLLSYGPSVAQMYRHASWYVHRILKGAKPAELPVQEPDRFRLVINLRTANQLGLKIPTEMLTRAEKLLR